MANIELSELTFDNIVAWPQSVKIIVCVLVCVLLLGMSYWVDTRPQLQDLAQSKQQEQRLRQEFEMKQQQAVNLNAYKAQLIEMRKSFGAMLMKLPSKTEVPGLLEDISKRFLTRKNGRHIIEHGDIGYGRANIHHSNHFINTFIR